MEWDAIGAVGEMIGAVGVIGSLLYLGFQIRLDRDATIANTTQMRADGARTMFLTAATSEKLTPAMAAVDTKPGPHIEYLMQHFELDMESALRMNYWWMAVVRTGEANFRLPLSDPEQKRLRHNITTLVNGPAGPWWDGVKSMFPIDFVAEVDRWRKQTD